MRSVRVTDDVSQSLSGSLKLTALPWHSDQSLRPQKRNEKSVTVEVSQSLIWPYRSSAFDESSNQWCTAFLIVESVMTLFVVGSGDGSGVAKHELSTSKISPDPSFLQCQRPFVPTPYTQFWRGLNRPSM